MAERNIPAEHALDNRYGSIVPDPKTVIGNEKNEFSFEKILKILHLEDIVSDAQLVANMLKKAGILFECLVVDSRDQFIKALENFSPDIILADQSLPSFSSSEALTIFKATGMKIPFILITSPMSDEFAVAIIKSGAEDYILKDRLNRLPVAIKNSLEKFRLEKERLVHLAEITNREKQFRLLVENCTDAVVIINAAGKSTYVSPSVKNILGYTEEEIMQLDLLSVAHPEDIPALAMVMERVLANPGVTLKGHTGRMRHKDGSWRWIEATVTNLLHDPVINGIVDNFRDITVNKLAEEKLINNENKFRVLIENGADGMAILSAEGKPLYISPSVKNVLGYSAEEAMQLNLLTISHPEDRHILITIMQQAIAEPGIPIKGEATRMSHKDGGWRWIDGVVTNMLHDPAINGFVDNFRDVTDRKVAEEKIIHANRLYAFISQLNQTIVHVQDEETLFKECCNIAIEIGQFKAAWIEKFNTEGKQISLVESCGMAGNAVYRFTNASYENNEPQYQVLNSDTYWVCNDIQHESAMENWKQFAKDTGIGSAMVLPIRKSGVIIGTFNLYATEINFFTSAEIALLNEATRDISFALGIFEKEKLKLLSDEKLAASELRLKQEQAIAHLGSWELNYKNGIAVWSDEQLRIFGLALEDKEQTFESWLSYIHPEDVDYVLRLTNETKSSLENSNFFHRIVRKDGVIRHLYSQTRVRFDTCGNPIGLYGIAQDVTEVKHAEQALRESESNLQAIFENTSEGFILTDTTGIIKSFNNKSKEIVYLNTEYEILIGASIYDFVHPSRKNAYKDSIERVLNGETLRYDYFYNRKNGDIKWFDFKVNPVFANGKTIGLSITSTDITERKQGEELLKRSESNLNAIIENTDAFIYSLDKNFRYITFNSALLKMMKELYGVNITPGYNVFDFIQKFDPAGVQEWKDIYSKALNGEIIKFEKEFIVDEFHSYTSFSIHPIWENKSVIGLSCFVHDITQAKKAAIAILKAAEEKNIILESIGDAFFAVDKNWIVTYWNNHAEKMLSVSKSSIVGRNLWYVFSASIDSESFKYYHLAVESRQMICFQDYFSSLNKWFEINAYPSESGLSVFFKDITQQRKSEAEKEKMTTDIVQRNKVLEQFSYIISHNLRAPVANIIGLAFTLQKDNLSDDKKSKVMSGLSSSVIKLDEVIKDLNDILKVRQEKKMHTEIVSFSKLANDIWVSIEHMIESQNATLNIDFSEVNQILTIKTYLHSIFYNLISNSLKYRQPGIPSRIEIKSYKLKNDIILIFKDNGLGIDLQKKGEEVFGLYKRFHTNHADGKGMGLYMVKTQVESLGGTITISSEVNKGTEFKIELKSDLLWS